MSRLSCLIVVLVLLIGALFFLSTVPKEQPTHTIEVDGPAGAMRIKPLLIASAAVALALPALAQQSAPQPPPCRRHPSPTSRPGRDPQPATSRATAEGGPTKARSRK